MSVSRLLYLDQLKPGQQCKLVDIDLEGATGQRLLDMGFIPGVEIKVIRNAPLVDPVELEVRGYYVSIRHAEAKHIEVSFYE
ncbi:ferrous iron transport protein A [Candidatus Woesearchaeota archaeon]|jgi:ferrous iron transport protein A|nr:ferrous iron transport protein A [Candidatus Woesearchaeota archaeon]